jgi:hypothetical protein
MRNPVALKCSMSNKQCSMFNKRQTVLLELVTKKHPVFSNRVLGDNLKMALVYAAQVMQSVIPPIVTANAVTTLARIPITISFFVSMGEV